MDSLNFLIGKKLKEIRNSRNLSLDEVSKLTNVSKAMLGQIERGQSNPTVSTLWKIATGLKVSFSIFIEENKDELMIVNKANIMPIIESDKKMRLYPIFPFDVNKGLEIFTIELESGCHHISTPHSDSVEEYIIVTEGQIVMNISGNDYILDKGKSIKFMANKPHEYKNITSNKSVFQNIIIYEK